MQERQAMIDTRRLRDLGGIQPERSQMTAQVLTLQLGSLGLGIGRHVLLPVYSQLSLQFIVSISGPRSSSCLSFSTSSVCLFAQSGSQSRMPFRINSALWVRMLRRECISSSVG
jgi:hypothetical protein